jgi:predicted small secreted protein
VTGRANLKLRRIAGLLAATAIALGLAACNTVEGAGKDIKATGKAIEKAVKPQ